MNIVFLISIIAVIIGSFLPWAKVVFATVLGVQTGGIFVIILAIINLIVYFVLKSQQKIVNIITVIVGALSIIIAFTIMSKVMGTPLSEVGIGLIIVLFGGAGLIASVFIKKK